MTTATVEAGPLEAHRPSWSHWGLEAHRLALALVDRKQQGGFACRRMALAHLGCSGARRHMAWWVAGGSMTPRPLTSLWSLAWRTWTGTPS